MSQRFRQILYEALTARIGLVLRSDDPLRARQALYAARAEAADPDLAVLQFRTTSPPDGNLVIIKETFEKKPGPEEFGL